MMVLHTSLCHSFSSETPTVCFWGNFQECCLEWPLLLIALVVVYVMPTQGHPTELQCQVLHFQHQTDNQNLWNMRTAIIGLINEEKSGQPSWESSTWGRILLTLSGSAVKSVTGTVTGIAHCVLNPQVCVRPPSHKVKLNSREYVPISQLDVEVGMNICRCQDTSHASGATPFCAT